MLSSLCRGKLRHKPMPCPVMISVFLFVSLLYDGHCSMNGDEVVRSLLLQAGEDDNRIRL